MWFYATVSILVGVLCVINSIVAIAKEKKISLQHIITMIFGICMITVGVLSFTTNVQELVYIIIMLALSVIYCIYINVCKRRK